MKHRTLASANLRRFIGAAALTAMIVPSVSVFADAADVSAADKVSVGDRLLISDYNSLIDILTPLNVDGTGILTTEGKLIIGTGGDFTVTDGATTLGGTTTTTGLLTANGGITVEDGDTVTINGVGLNAIETYAEGNAGSWATVSNPATDLSTGYDTQLATMGWSAGLLKYQMSNLDITYFNGFTGLGTPASGDIMVWNGVDSWVSQADIPTLDVVGALSTGSFSVDSGGATTLGGTLDVTGATTVHTFTIADDTDTNNVLAVDNTTGSSLFNLVSGTDLALYSDAGTTNTFYVDGATGNVTASGTFGMGDTTINGTLDVTGIVTENAGVVVDQTTFDANALTTTGTNNFTVSVVDDQDIILDTGLTGGVQINRIKMDSELISEVTSSNDTWATDSGKDTAVPTTKAVNTMIAGAIGGGQSGNFTDLTVTGPSALNGGLTMDTNKFTVADETGNTAIAGTLDVGGATTLNSTVGLGDGTGVDTVTISTGTGDLVVTNFTGGVLQSDASGVISSSSTLAAAITAPGITMTGDITMGSSNISGTGTVTATTLTDGTASITGGNITGVVSITATTATATNLVIGTSAAVTSTATGVADNDVLTTKGYVDDAVDALAAGVDLDTQALGTCDVNAEGVIRYNNNAGVGTFWGCAETTSGATPYTWVALSIFES